jgi:hypothetical protein
MTPRLSMHVATIDDEGGIGGAFTHVGKSMDRNSQIMRHMCGALRVIAVHEYIAERRSAAQARTESGSIDAAA